MTTKIILKSTDRVNPLTSANECEFYIDWGSILDDGKYRVKYSICKTIKPIPTFQQLLVNKPPWARYDASSLNATTQILTDLTGNGRNATCSSCFIATQVSPANGSGVLMTSICGSAGAGKIQFPIGSCPQNHTICFISRYRGALATQKKILVSDQGAYFGHNNTTRGSCFYGNTVIANNVTSVPVITYLNMCVSSTVPAPNNVLCNGVSNGILGLSPITPFTSTLGINTNAVIDNAGFELTQLFIWDRQLTYIEMNVVSNSLSNFLATGILV